MPFFRRPQQRIVEEDPFDREHLRTLESALRDMPLETEDIRAYLEKHIPRLARTLALVPPPQTASRTLELGCYMQITPLLNRICGYREVRGAYYGPLGKIDRKTVHFPDGDFHCAIDNFDAERDSFPYPDAHFDLIVAGEVIEHLIHDPMFLLLEARRVLIEGGWLLLTTPNISGLASVAKVLEGKVSPQIYPFYKRPDGEPEVGHRREYTVWELGQAVKAAGFEIDRLFTTGIEEYAGHSPLLELLRKNGYNTADRGEQIWCLSRKRDALPIERFPHVVFGP